MAEFVIEVLVDLIVLSVSSRVFWFVVSPLIVVAVLIGFYFSR